MNTTHSITCPTCKHRTKSERRAYFVRSTTKVDRPELRGPTFSAVAVNTRVQNLREVSSAKGAKAVVAELLRGEDDFASEYISSVDAYSVLVRVSYNEFGRTELTPVGRRHYLTPQYMRDREPGSDTGTITCRLVGE